MSGPAPKPTELKILQGNPGRRPLNTAEPKPRPERPRCPIWLSKEAKREWRRIVPELEAMRLLTVVDRAALAGYCQAYARWRQAEEILEAEGLIFETPNGYLQQRPEVSIAQKSLQLMKSFAAEFGFTPSSRTRISVTEREPEDPFEAFLGKANGTR